MEKPQEEVSTADVFQQSYLKLVQTLPMKDAIFVADLFTNALLPDDVKDRVESCATSAEKASYFLDQVVKPSVTSGVGSNFDKLLKVMEDSKYLTVNELAKQIKRERCKRTNTATDCTLPPKKPKIDISRLKARYQKQLPTSKTDWPKHRVTKYIRLALIEKEDVTLRDDDLSELTKLTLQGDVDSILKKKEPLRDLRDIFFYQDEPCPRLILIMGGPGIGKTTLANEICLKWAKDEFLTKDFDAVVLIPMRSVRQKLLEEVLKERVGEENYQQLQNSAGSRCLIILEGFDELAISRRSSDPFLTRLIQNCTILEGATIIITSRPHACEDLNADRKIEIIGFGNNEIKEFVGKSFLDQNQSVKFLQQLDDYPHLHSLCYVPMNLVMIVDIFRYKQKLPGTLTELYQLFIVMTLRRQIKKQPLMSTGAVKPTDGEKMLCKMLTGIPKEMVEIVLLLSGLAYRGLFEWYENSKRKITPFGSRKHKEPRIIFTESDLTECDIEVTPEFDGFGLLKATHTHQLYTDANTYNFAHLTIQEFLCAVHISLLSQQEQLRLLKENLHEYPNVFIFVCSLAEVGSSKISQYIYSRLTIRNGGDVITAVRCINESKWLQNKPVEPIPPFTFNFTAETLLPYDCFSISCVLSCHPVSRLILKGCKIGNKGIKLLVSNQNTTGKLEELDLLDNKITTGGVEDVLKIVMTNATTLKVFNIGKNDIGDEGMAMISRTLQNNQLLNQLKVEECGLSAKGASHVSQLLSVTHMLQVLDMSGNDIGDEGMEVISQALQHNTQLMITELWVVRCGLSAKGAISISEMMMVTHSLQKLHVGCNNISDDGISAIAGAFGNCKISELNAVECGITLVGTRSLAAALSSNHTIRVLWLQDNPVTVEGTQLINAAVQNTNCHYVGINSEYKKKEFSALTLERRSNQLKAALQQKKVTVDAFDDRTRTMMLLPVLQVGLPANPKASLTSQIKITQNLNQKDM